MTAATDGSGSYGDSLEESLKVLPPVAAGALPGLYPANWSSTCRKRGDCWDTFVLRPGPLSPAGQARKLLDPLKGKRPPVPAGMPQPAGSGAGGMTAPGRPVESGVLACGSPDGRGRSIGGCR